jgi:hypothetical protein
VFAQSLFGGRDMERAAASSEIAVFECESGQQISTF